MKPELHLDFESFSEKDIKVGGIRYSEDPSTEILVVGYAFGDEKPKVWFPTWPEKSETPADLKEALANPDCLIYAHNANFERGMIENVATRQMGWPVPHLSRYRCTAAISSSLALPRALEDVAIALNIAKKDKEGKRLIAKFSKPRKPSKKDPRVRTMPSDDPDDFLEFGIYCHQDVIVEREVHRRLKKFELTPEEQKIWELDSMMNFRGFYVDLPGVKAAIDTVEHFSVIDISRCEEITGGIRPTQREKIKAWLNERDCLIPNMQADVITEWLKHDDWSPEVREVLEIKKRSGRVAVKKLYPMSTDYCKDGTIKGSLKYCGAERTGRWSGQGVQPHNFMRPTLKRTEDIILPLISGREYEGLDLLYEDPLEAVGSCMRHYVTSRPGKVLYVADYAAIEARIICWLAGQDDALEVFREGKDIYKVMASKVFNVPIEKINGEQRQVGKGMILGCGFGMGWERFMAECENKFGVKVSKELAKEAVKTYRETYYKVKQLWKDLNNACIKCVKTGKTQRCGKVKIFMEDIFMRIELPSGRKLSYMTPKVKQKRNVTDGRAWYSDSLYFKAKGKGSHMVWEDTYGGKLAENITQATARDLMAPGMLNAEELGFEMILTIHDELVAEQDEDFATVEAFEEAVCPEISWAEGLPLKAEGYKSKRYKKA